MKKLGKSKRTIDMEYVCCTGSPVCYVQEKRRYPSAKARRIACTKHKKMGRKVIEHEPYIPTVTYTDMYTGKEFEVEVGIGEYDLTILVEQP